MTRKGLSFTSVGQKIIFGLLGYINLLYSTAPLQELVETLPGGPRAGDQVPDVEVGEEVEFLWRRMQWGRRKRQVLVFFHAPRLQQKSRWIQPEEFWALNSEMEIEHKVLMNCRCFGRLFDCSMLLGMARCTRLYRL